jgi:hypothetical protein
MSSENDDMKSSSGGAPACVSAIEAARERKTYSRPKLRYLGSVRELTLGSGANQPDAARTQRP